MAYFNVFKELLKRKSETTCVSPPNAETVEGIVVDIREGFMMNRLVFIPAEGVEVVTSVGDPIVVAKAYNVPQPALLSNLPAPPFKAKITCFGGMVYNVEVVNAYHNIVEGSEDEEKFREKVLEGFKKMVEDLIKIVGVDKFVYCTVHRTYDTLHIQSQYTVYSITPTVALSSRLVKSILQAISDTVNAFTLLGTDSSFIAYTLGAPGRPRRRIPISWFLPIPEEVVQELAGPSGVEEQVREEEHGQ